MDSSNSKPVKLKIKKPVIVKSFRLIDFHIYDESAKKEESDSGSDDGTHSKYKKRTDELQFVIQMFGINEKGDTCCIYVNDYLPFFYVKVGDNWDEYTMRSFVLDLQANTKLDNRFKDSIVDFELVDHYKLYGFSGGRKHKFIKLVFKNTVAMNKYKNLWYTYNSEPDAKEYRTRKNIVYQGTSVELYESNIPPLLRYFHIHNISPSGWVSFKMNKVRKSSIPTTTCKYEVICPLKELHSQPEKETRVPYKICSFDIEASSSHGDFPIPIKTYKRFAANVVDIFIKQMKVLDDSQSKLLLQKMILSAFGYGKFQDIDLVYPKNKPSKKMLEARSNLVLNESLEAVRKTTLEEDNSHLLTIDGIFEQMKENEQYTGTGEDNDNNGEQVESSEYTGQQYGKYKRKPKVKKNSTIIDILLNEEYARDEKIQIFNEIMTRIFPALKGDEVTFIGSTFLKYGEKEPYLNHCLVVGSCDKVPNVEIECADTEQELLIKWTELIQREDPDIIIGYNIFGFDYEFMFRRAQETYCEREFLLLSRKINEICAKENREKPGEFNLEHTKIQIASGEYDLRFAKMTGRLQIDMYAYFRRDFNLSSYKLDDVAGQFISDSVKYVCNSTHPELGDVTELCSKNLMGLNVGDFIHIELTGFTADYFNDGQKFIVADIELNKSVTHTVKGVEETNTYNVIVIKGHYELDNSKSIKWGMAKDDVTPQDIFRLSKGSASDRAIVAKYCIQDCNLVHHLMNKIDVITGYVEMSRICSVPISFLVFRGQGIKLTSYVAKKCRDKDTLMPDLEKTWKEEGYEGAIVLPPKCSMYMDNPVACVDYSSLYPSSMISQNYSHDSKVWSKEYDLDGKLIRVVGEQNKKGEFIYDNLPEYHYINIEFDTYEYLRNPNNPVSKKVKTKVGKMVCRWAQFPDNKKGIMPSILEELLKARKDTRKMIKTEKDPFMQNILDKRQLGYKVTANSLYGQCGSRTSTFYEKDVAASTTATGRMMIIYAKRIVEEVYGDRIYNTVSHGPVRTKAEYVYGDSVAKYTPVYVRVNGKIVICEISALAHSYGNNNWVTCTEEGKQDKEFCELNNVESWTDNGWTRLHRIIRHKLASHKKMMRVLTHTGAVDVTDDHSLLLKNGTEISPKDVEVGTKLLHSTLLPDETQCKDTISVEEAKIYGFFFGDGSCGTYKCQSGSKSSWALNNANDYILDKYMQLCKTVYPEYDWIIYDTLESSGVYKISFTCNEYGEKKQFIENYRKDTYYNNNKIIPDFIINGTQEIREAFWEGLYDADGDKDYHGYIRIDQKSQLSASHICWLANSIGYKTSINTRSDKTSIYRITATMGSQRKCPDAVKKISEITDYDDYVYDLTTTNHHFAAGVGNMIVHNTDSVFFTFNLENADTGEKIRGQPALEMTIEIAQDAADLCTKYLKPPMGLEYEKTLMPFILLSKKRYVGMLYEENPNKGYMKFMGLSLKRRDSCDYLKDVYGGILNILMKDNNIENAIQFLQHSLNDLIEGNVSMDKLAITKALRSGYKNPNQIGHFVLAERIGKRDPGNKPKPGDRMKFVFIVNDTPKALMGDKIETPEFIVENKLKIDYTHYITNQLMKPLQQLFGLALEQIWELQGKSSAIKTYRKELIKLENEFPDTETFMKKKEKYSSAKIKVLLFDNVLNKIYNQKNNIQTITSFFQR
jgi:DNA polymerase elongation subunit (family B)